MKAPVQDQKYDIPSMCLLSDSMKTEYALILLSPGTFLYAYKYIVRNLPHSLKIFVPSLRPEFISDVFNLYMNLKDLLPVEWVFPESYEHYSFELGHIKDSSYMNPVDCKISISYIPNENVDHVYDIVVDNPDATNYFPMHLTEDQMVRLYADDNITYVHVPKSSTLYGGLTYNDAYNINPKFKRKMIPYAFTSSKEFAQYALQER